MALISRFYRKREHTNKQASFDTFEYTQSGCLTFTRVICISGVHLFPFVLPLTLSYSATRPLGCLAAQPSAGRLSTAEPDELPMGAWPQNRALICIAAAASSARSLSPAAYRRPAALSRLDGWLARALSPQPATREPVPVIKFRLDNSLSTEAARSLDLTDPPLAN